MGQSQPKGSSWSYYNLSSVCGSVCLLSPRPFMGLLAPSYYTIVPFINSFAVSRPISTKLLILAIFLFLWSYYNLSSVCMRESQGGNPIGKALVKINWIKVQEALQLLDSTAILLSMCGVNILRLTEPQFAYCAFYILDDVVRKNQSCDVISTAGNFTLVSSHFNTCGMWALVCCFFF